MQSTAALTHVLSQHSMLHRKTYHDRSVMASNSRQAEQNTHRGVACGSYHTAAITKRDWLHAIACSIANVQQYSHPYIPHTNSNPHPTSPRAKRSGGHSVPGSVKSAWLR